MLGVLRNSSTANLSCKTVFLIWGIGKERRIHSRCIKFNEYLQSLNFPVLVGWERFLSIQTIPENIVRSTTIRVHKDLRQYRLSNDREFSRFLEVFWRASKYCYEIWLWKLICKFVSDCRQSSLNVCHLCSTPSFNLAAHVACSCAITIDTQNNWGTDNINKFTIYMYLPANRPEQWWFDTVYQVM